MWWTKWVSYNPFLGKFSEVALSRHTCENVRNREEISDPAIVVNSSSVNLPSLLSSNALSFWKEKILFLFYISIKT